MNNEGHVKYLGPAFFTKWLYFASANNGPDDRNAAPILDRQVCIWMERYAGIRLNLYRTNHYARYVDLLTQWGDQYGRTPVQVEKAIFGEQTGRS